MQKIKDGDIYEGPVGLLKDSSWLTAESLPPDRDTYVQIETVRIRKDVEFRNETKRVYGSLVFVGKDRELGLNSTNIAVLAALYGPVAKGWFKRWIALYVDPDVKAFGKTVSAVRIRPKRLDGPPKSATTGAPRRPEDGDAPVEPGSAG